MNTCTKCAARLPLRFFPLIDGQRNTDHANSEHIKRAASCRKSRSSATDSPPFNSLNGVYFVLLIRKCRNLVIAVWQRFRNGCEEWCYVQADLEHVPNMVTDYDEIVPTVLQQIYLRIGTFPVDPCFKASTKVRNCTSKANQTCNILAHLPFEIVELISNFLRRGHESRLEFPEKPTQLCSIHDQTRICNNRLLRGVQNSSQLCGQERQLNGEKAPQNLSGSSSDGNSLFMLLLRDSLCLTRNFSSPVSRPVGKHRNNRGCHGCHRTDTNCDPVGQIPNFIRERTDLHRHKCSLMLVRILPRSYCRQEHPHD